VNLEHAVATFRGHREPRFRLIEHRNWWFLLSGTVILLSLAGLLIRGLNLSIDFEGGAQISYPLRDPSVTVADVQDTLATYGRTDAEVQIVNGTQIMIRTATLTGGGAEAVTRVQALKDALAKQAGVGVDQLNITDIGPTWGSEISKKALQGLIVVLLAITVYIAFRFEWKMSIAAQVAMIHDVVITAGVYALTGREVTPATIIAILTILGFSLYDTVVIFDKIKENTESPVMLAKDSYGGVVNTSLNSVFMRSVNTSLVVLFPVLSLLLFGGSTLKDFAFAMMIGVITGAYSSIFVASQLLVVLKEREPKYQQIRARAAAREGAGRQLRPVPDRPVLPADANGEEAVRAAVGAAAASRATARTTSGGAARPRPKGKKKPPAKRKRR
jgi:preprotein translocase subunit SecF